MWLPDAQLYHYRARAYAPQIGRFLQTDPMGYQAGVNLYAYVGGDPVNWNDPLGLQEAGTIRRDLCTGTVGYIVTVDGVEKCQLLGPVPNIGNTGDGVPTDGGNGGVDKGKDEKKERCESLLRASQGIGSFATGFGVASLAASTIGAGALLIPEPAVSKVISGAAFGAAFGFEVISLELSVASAVTFGAATGDWGQAFLLGGVQIIDNSAFGREAALFKFGSSVAGTAGDLLVNKFYENASCD